MFSTENIKKTLTRIEQAINEENYSSALDIFYHELVNEDIEELEEELKQLELSGSKYTITELESQGFEGTDASLEISLFEYGMAIHESEDGTITVIYGARYNSEGTHFNQFIETYFDSKYEIYELFDESWFSFEDFSNYADLQSKAEAQQLHLASLLHSMKQYYGNPNIFGSITEAELFKIHS